MNTFILDVDGVMTTGHFFYDVSGKVFKVFGPDDHDALNMLREKIEIRFITGDKSGYEISKQRISGHMKFPIDLVSTTKRLDWIQKKYPDLEKVIYMGDGIFDHYVMKEVGYAISTANAHDIAKKYAHFVTDRRGGDRAVAQACLHIMEKFFESYDPEKPLSNFFKL